MTTTFADAAWQRPTPQALKRAGHMGIIGYVSHDTSKNITRREFDAYLSAGLQVALVFEDSAQRALQGAAAGLADAHTAITQARALGYPKGATIFAACDDNAATASAVRPYFAAWAKAVKAAGFVDGAYGPGPVAKLCTIAWKVETWGDPHYDPSCHLIQQANNPIRLIPGTDTDVVQRMFPAAGRRPVPKPAAPPAKKAAPTPTHPVINTARIDLNKALHNNPKPGPIRRALLAALKAIRGIR